MWRGLLHVRLSKTGQNAIVLRKGNVQKTNNRIIYKKANTMKVFVDTISAWN